MYLTDITPIIQTTEVNLHRQSMF